MGVVRREIREYPQDGLAAWGLRTKPLGRYGAVVRGSVHVAEHGFVSLHDLDPGTVVLPTEPGRVN